MATGRRRSQSEIGAEGGRASASVSVGAKVGVIVGAGVGAANGMRARGPRSTGACVRVSVRGACMC
eukprot:6128373-Pleurochrysis_carterae.AAC.2